MQITPRFSHWVLGANVITVEKDKITGIDKIVGVHLELDEKNNRHVTVELAGHIKGNRFNPKDLHRSLGGAENAVKRYLRKKGQK